MSNNCSVKFQRNEEGVRLELAMKDSYIRKNARSEENAHMMMFTIEALQRGFAQSMFKFVEENMTDACVGSARELVIRKVWRAMQDSLDEEMARILQDKDEESEGDDEDESDEEGLRNLLGSLQKFSDLLEEVNKK